MSIPLIIGASQQKRSGRPFIIKVNYASGFTVTLPLSGTCNFIVDWGDGAVGQITSPTDVDRIHTYASGGTYTITMTGTLQGFNGATAGMYEYIISVEQWGRTGFTYITMGVGGTTSCKRLVYTKGKLITSQTTFAYMFLGCSALTSCDVSEWDVSAITDFGLANWTSGMFSGCTALTSLDCSNWVFSTSSPVRFSAVFSGCSNLTTIGSTSAWNTSKFYSISAAFSGCAKLTTSSIDVSAWDTSNITTLMATFANCYKLTAIDVSSWNVTKCTQFGYVWGVGTFENCIKLTSLDLSGWVINTTSNVSMGRLVKNCTVLTTVGTISGWNMSKVTYLNSMFMFCPTLTSITLTNWNVSACTDFQNMFLGCTNAATIDVSGWTLNTTAASVLVQNMFSGCTALTSLDVTSWNTSKVTNTAGMFQGCNNTSFTSITGISGWDMSANTNMYNMFYGCTKLTTLDVSAWNVANVTRMTGVFTNCSSLATINVNSWNVTKCTDFGALHETGMFQSCVALTSLDLSGWVLNTSANVTFRGFLNGCTSLTSVGDLSGWNTSKVTDLNAMFQNCNNASFTTLNLANWNLSLCTTFISMFNNCNKLTSLTISGWTLNSSANIDMTSIFQSCAALTSIDITSWNMTKVTNTTNMFLYCSELLTLSVPSTLLRVDGNFARECGKITTCNFYPNTSPTVSGTPFTARGSSCVLHVPSGTSSYTTSPWNSSTYFAQPITKDL